ncbi:MAG: hypothetical protein WCK41_00770 [Actinomycetes bacterium]
MTTVDSSAESGHESLDGDGEARSRWGRVGRFSLGLVVVLLIAMWGGIFFGFFDKTAPGTLDDRSYGEQSETLCASAKQQLDALPKAFETTDHVARADVVAQSNLQLRALLDQISVGSPANGRDGMMTQEWLGDWATYIANREDYATRLRSDEMARFYETPKSSASEQISKPIDRFAYVNHMPSCDTPKDMS